jgi:2-succinyl-5-enolpyruvyl-6-hydroxy-3-cyclohexene-1-carboxylate synthase
MRPNPSTALAEVVVDELVRNGVRFVAISPGSRSAALAIAAAGHPDMTTVVVIDERSAAFWALGRAKAGEGAAVLATSGTAPANWFPAVVEADMSRTPLVLLSADRPAELRGVGANQTIDQVGMFGDKVRLSVDVPAPDGSDGNARWREAVCQAVAVARGAAGSAGPVHLNVSFREPTVPVTDDGRSAADPYPHPVTGRDGGRPWVEVEPDTPGEPGGEVPGSGRGLVIAGDGDYDRDGLLAAASRLGWPVLATALSGLRGQRVVDAYHHLLVPPVADRLIPEVAVALGSVGPSDRLESLIRAARHRIRVDRWGRSIDPARNATARIAADPVAVLASVDPDPEPAWIRTWSAAQERVRRALEASTEAGSGWTGAAAVGAVQNADWECLVVGSSLPIREVDAHLTRLGRVIANRGASGIDGTVSTALGVSTVVSRTVLVAGDLALLHDANGFLAEEVSPLVVVVLDNGGGGLFDSLPQAAHAPEYERLFVTPSHRDMADLARLHRLAFFEPSDSDDLTRLVDESLESGRRTLIRVPIDRRVDLEARRELEVVARSVLEAES